MPAYEVAHSRLRDEITRIEREGGERVVTVVDDYKIDKFVIITEYVGARPLEIRPGMSVSCTVDGCRVCRGDAA